MDHTRNFAYNCIYIYYILIYYEHFHHALELPEEAQHPASSPIYWISKWVDYSDKYGIGYQLCDNSVGVLYNDSTRIILHENGEQLQYLAKDHTETMCTMTNYPTDLKKKVALVNYFRKYMNEHLLKVSLTPTLTSGLCKDHRPKNRFLGILNLILTPIIEIKIYEFFF